MQDQDLDKLLGAASTPSPSFDYEKRLLAKFSSNKNVVAFPKRKPVSPWLIGLPLAASLVLGFWLGTSSSVLNPTRILLAQSTEDITGNGFDDVVALIEDNLT